MLVNKQLLEVLVAFTQTQIDVAVVYEYTNRKKNWPVLGS